MSKIPHNCLNFKYKLKFVKNWYIIPKYNKVKHLTYVCLKIHNTKHQHSVSRAKWYFDNLAKVKILRL